VTDTPITTTTSDTGAQLTPVLAFHRDVRIFARHGELMRELEDERDLVQLAPDQLYHPDVPCDGAVRLGNLRVSEFLPDGSEVTRAVLQAGAVFTTRSSPATDAADTQRLPAAYPLTTTVLMALGETELWVLPPGSLAGALA
jgi:hypothetical protein